ncbi:MAG: threonine-phosphate decarboxylase [Proteobacteria bacterium]|nr:threonine-phosphate decarboxylase [Pseudomonadota bacterium]
MIEGFAAKFTASDTMRAPIAHGGGLIAAQRRRPDAPRPWIDLSTGINPVPYPLPPLPPEALLRLPEPEQAAALEAAAARAYGAADPACVAAGPGTQALIHLLPRLVPARSVAVVGPTYAEHAAAWRLAGASVSEVPDLPAAETAQVAVLVNPNNPDGRAVPPEALLLEAARRAASGGLLVVDEAFADFDGPSVVPELPRAGLLVLRSFGKAYGLAGLRLGFAVAPAPLAAAIRAALGPWAVSGPALHAGLAALPDAAWREAAAARLAADAARLDALFAGAGGAVLGGTRLFRLVRHPNAAALADRLADAGILVRRFGYAPDWLRFGLPAGEAAWARLAAALV